MKNLLDSENSFALVEKNVKGALELSAASALNGIVDGFSKARSMQVRQGFSILWKKTFIYYHKPFQSDLIGPDPTTLTVEQFAFGVLWR